MPAVSTVQLLGRLRAAMKGIITGRDVLRHSFTILRLWGPATYLRCLYAMVTRRSVTFLEVIHEGDRYPT